MFSLGKRRNYSNNRNFSPGVGFSRYHHGRATGTRYLSLRRVRYHRRGPFRTGGFYGSSVRSPAEKKVIDTAQANYTLDTTADIVLINGVATGTDFTQRIGRKINCCSVQLRGAIHVTNDGAQSNLDSMMCRIMIVEDSQSNGSAPAITDILTATGDPTAFNNLNNRERFKVHYDKMFTIPPYNTNIATQNTNALPTINMYKKIWIPVIFEGTAASIGSIASGSLWLVTLSDNSGDQWRLSASVRVRFYDA